MNEVSETARGYHRELDSQILMIFHLLDVTGLKYMQSEMVQTEA